ncbi:MAG: MBOAT family protein [Gammaproteobacteria bacterium]|nr:MBOAT family protein [Gammaproteobacteria bacterium]
MLFNSYIFLLFFLPITFTGFFLIGGRGHHRIAIAWLVGASLFFYSWWNPAYLGLILASIFVNYAVGVSLGGAQKSKTLLTVGIVFNLLLLGYFKYANFFVDNLNALTGSDLFLEAILLPLAISFFTFQQIAYLVDAYQGETKEYNFLHYCLFVTFFPQLIAGPIVHHKEMLPQFAKDAIYKIKHRDVVIGLTILILGLFKKIVMADGIAVYSTPIFNAAADGQTINFLEAWGGVLAYSFQLYFDFSGYSDMAIGIARLFSIQLPINFNSPYKAVNIIDFWRRWHITLSRFLRDYLYIPLGGNRNGPTRRHINLLTTMILGGLWHGASWNFAAWGGLHGLYLVINHFWRTIYKTLGWNLLENSLAYYWFSRIITFLAVVIAWVPFRAADADASISMLRSMFGLNGITLPTVLRYKLGDFGVYLEQSGVSFGGFFILDIVQWATYGAPAIIFLLLTSWFAPNTLQIMSYQNQTTEIKVFRFKPSFAWSFVTAVLLITCLSYMNRASEFMYFQF